MSNSEDEDATVDNQHVSENKHSKGKMPKKKKFKRLEEDTIEENNTRR
jgi:hypothetical protein